MRLKLSDDRRKRWPVEASCYVLYRAQEKPLAGGIQGIIYVGVLHHTYTCITSNRNIVTLLFLCIVHIIIANIVLLICGYSSEMLLILLL
jgi:hypothetical protein